MNSPKLCLLRFISVLLLLSYVDVMALPTTWQNLSSIQKKVLQNHRNEWNDYSETKQGSLLENFKEKIKGIKSSKEWFLKNLSIKEQKVFLKNKKNMSEKKFTRYVDKLIKKYGKPKNN